VSAPAAVTRPAARRRAGLLAGLLAALVGVTGCQLHPGAAAFVGSQRITESEVDRVTDGAATATGKTPSQSDRTTLRRQVTEQLVQRIVLDRVGRDLGVRVADSEVEAQINLGAKQAGGRAALLKQVGGQGLSAERLQTAAHIQVTVAELEGKLAKVTDSELQAAYASSGAAQQGISTLEARPTLLGQIAQQRNGGNLLQQRVVAFVKRVKVRVNPRFGSFNASQLTLSAVATDPLIRDLSSPKAPVAQPGQQAPQQPTG
jgi:hypothetical protein